MNRREFIIGSTGALLAAAAGTSYLFSGCPLDTEGTGLCTGPCSAFIDLNGDNYCDRVSPPLLVSTGFTRSGEEETSTTELQRACPFGLTDDPYPGQCRLYIDTDGDGLCDLSVGTAPADGSDQSAAAPREPEEMPPDTTMRRTACPLGLVNDPFPGECRRYVDSNGNNICDLSEPELIASGQIEALPTPTAPPTLEPNVSPTPPVQTACPYGLVNDPFPGECRRYIDANGNKICDLSEPELIISGAVLPPDDSTAERHTGQGGQGGNRGQRRGAQNP